MSGVERVEADGVHVVPARRTVVTALPLKAEARERLAAALGARVIDIRTECADADLVIAPSSSPQLLGRLRERYPTARLVVTELADEDLDIELTGPVTRLLRAGADAYVVADGLDDLAHKLGAPADGSSATELGQEHSMPMELLTATSWDDLVTLLHPAQAPADGQPVERRAADG